MGDQGVEIPVAQDGHHQIDVSCRESHRISQPLFLHFEEFGEGAVRSRNTGERCGVLRIVQIEKLNASYP